jgi:hypothetical protein
MLTNKQAREAKPRAAKYEVTCDALPGFVLRVLPTGKKVFFARYRDAAGRDHRQRLGLMEPGFGVDEARRMALVVMAQQDSGPIAPEPAAAGPKVEAAPPGGPKSPTIRDFARRFEQDHIDMYLKPRTAAKYRSVLRRHILPEFGDRRLDEVAPADVQRAHSRLKSTPCTANYMKTVLGIMYSKAEQWGETTARNPTQAVQRLEEKAVERFLSPEERQALERVLATAARTPSGRPGHIGREAIWGVRLLLLTGMPLVPAFSSVIASINNMGPGIGPTGPAGNYQVLTDFQTWVCTLAMLLGRLEVFSVLVLFTPTFWRK